MIYFFIELAIMLYLFLLIQIFCEKSLCVYLYMKFFYVIYLQIELYFFHLYQILPKGFLKWFHQYIHQVFPSFCFFTSLSTLDYQFDGCKVVSHCDFISFLKLMRLSIILWVYLPFVFLCLLPLWITYLRIFM